MNSRKNTILILLLGLLLVAFAVSVAQTPAQGDQKEKAEACCSMESCCCNSGSCPMKDSGAEAKAEGKECCCCSGDSCDIKAKDDTKKGSCCNMKHKHSKSKAKQKAA